MMRCNKCPGKNALAEMNGIPTCKSCFRKMIEEYVSPKKAYMVH